MLLPYLGHPVYVDIMLVYYTNDIQFMHPKKKVQKNLNFYPKNLFKRYHKIDIDI